MSKHELTEENWIDICFSLRDDCRREFEEFCEISNVWGASDAGVTAKKLYKMAEIFEWYANTLAQINQIIMDMKKKKNG